MTLGFVTRIDLAKASVVLRAFLTLDPAAVASFCKYFEDRKLSRKHSKWKNPTYKQYENQWNLPPWLFFALE